MGKRKITSTNTINRDYLKNECGTMYALTLLSGRWKMTILHKLSKKGLRFTELKECIPNISDRMLSLHLKEMERDGLVERNVFAEVPPRVEYTLTSSTRDLVSIWDRLDIWGNNHREIQESNVQYLDGDL
ncbi:helix-turn-helix domain-containing protein [Galbibacter sp. EGI 63066]|uniref:winged helix-turn-helix transcriptional regulator n=1 Tax=Galbibacter sp. EGI 63066 TaxID=2993559 RepID=UPI002248CCBA|nr:helix-turn-helix domain-containing protein [Galbibacter sp. EGI 63066]MCX2680366.1 helix-turn-helix domain-containing protein [Galbibacter sp. EGI 63066]